MKRLLFAVIALLFAACTTDVTEDIAVEAPETLRVSFEEDTRIQLMNGKTVWNEGDLVSVFYRSDANQQWKFQGNTGDRSGTIKRVSTPEYSHTTSKMVVAYPYNKNYYLNPETCNLQAFLPAEQTYLKDSYGINGNIMVSQSEYKQFVLKSVCGWLKIQLKGEGQVVKKVTLKGNNSEQVAGEIYVNTADATSILAAEMGFSSDDTQVGGTMVEDDTILTEVTLNCGEGVTLGSESTAFYIALPPQEFSKGVTLKVLYGDGTTMTKSTSNSIEIARNTILPMSTLYYDGNVPPVYELAYTTNDGEPLDPYTTEGFGANFVENIFDPATGKGALKFDGRVTTIPAKAFVACSNLTQIELTKDITKIDAEAFSNCTALAVMDIPQGVNTIGDKAFYNCSGMTEITIPSSVTSIGTSSFEGCGGKANINCKINYSDFEKAKFTEVVIGDSVTSIGSYAFYNFTWLTSVTIPDSVTEIGGDAFYRCKSLTSVTIGDSVTSIGSSAFEDCTSLTSVTIPDSVTEIGGDAFCNCKSLTSVTIGDSVTSIGSSAFWNCTSLKEVYYNGDLSAWCKIDFNAYSNPMNNGAKLYLNSVELTEATIPSNVTEIKDYTFSGCTSLTSVTIPDSVTSIEQYAFKDCTSLTSVTIPDSVTSIGYGAFSHCKSLTSVTIPDSVTEIGSYAFRNCTSLTSVTIPDSVTEIGEDAFYKCTSLTSVTIGDSVTEIGELAFYDCTSLTSVTIPDSVTEIGEDAFGGCTSLTAFYGKFASADNRCLVINGVLNSFARSGLTEYTIPDSVTEIGEDAFSGCTSLTSVSIPDSVTSIGNEAFYWCTSLTSITIPDSVTSIGESAFSYCTSLTSVTIGNSVTSIGYRAFDDCTSLKEVYCKPTTPPAGSSYMFDNNASGRKIYVPASDDDSVINAYKAAAGWSEYATDIEENEFTE